MPALNSNLSLVSSAKNGHFLSDNVNSSREKSFLKTYKDLTGTDVFEFTEQLVKVLDVVIVTGNTNVMSKPQERLFNAWAAEAELGITPYSTEVGQLDVFLANYKEII